MWIANDPQDKQIVDSLRGAACRDCSFPFETTKRLGYFEIQEVRSVQRFVAREDALIDVLPGSRQEHPIDYGGRIQNNHRASRSSRIKRAESK